LQLELDGKQLCTLSLLCKHRIENNECYSYPKGTSTEIELEINKILNLQNKRLRKIITLLDT